MQNDKLLPCPFCGGEAKLIKHFVVALGVEYHQVFCTSCCAKRPVDKFFSEEEAIKQWNTRKPMERIVEQLEKSKNYYEKDHGVEMGLEIALDIVKGGVDNAG